MRRSPRPLNQDLGRLRDVLRNIELRRQWNDTCSNRKSNMSLPKERNVLPLAGEIDLNVSPRIASTFSEMIRKKPSRLVVDLSRVTYIDSSGLAVLIGAMQDVEEYGGKFALAGLHDNVRSIFETARVDQVFLTYPHVDAALAAD